MLSNEQIAEIKERYKESTPGEWCIPPSYSGVTSQANGDVCLSIGENKMGNMQFIAFAHQYIPWLLAERAELQEELKLYKGKAVKARDAD